MVLIINCSPVLTRVIIISNNAENVDLMEEKVMAIEINPKDTTREMAFDLWMKAPNPMVTFFKTLDVTNLVRLSKKKNLKFNMLIDFCIGKAASNVKEFYILLQSDCSLFIPLFFIFLYYSLQFDKIVTRVMSGEQ